MNPESPKLTPILKARVQQAARGDMLDLIFELPRHSVEATPGLTREERIAPVRDAFRHDATPLEHAITAAGGTVTGEAWINQTLRARVPVEALSTLASLDEVVSIDLPRTLMRESG